MRSLLLISLCLLNFACNSGSGGGGTPTGGGPQGSPGPTVNPTPEPTATPEPTPPPADIFGEAGAATWTLEADLQLGQDEGQFAHGCDANGNPKWVTDSNLKVGAKFDELQRAWVVNEGEGKLRLDTTITSVASKSIGKLLKVTESTIANIPVGAQANIVCTLNDKNEENCTQARAGNIDLYNNCYVDAQGTATYARGKLKLASGKTVTAYRIKVLYAGNLNADCAIQGAANETAVVYQTGDVASPDFNYCGGTTVLVYRKIAQEGNTVRLDLTERRVNP
jgi:hypothetical protein